MLGMMMVERDRGWGRRGTTKGGNGRGKSSRIEGMVGYMDREWTVYAYGEDDGGEGPHNYSGGDGGKGPWMMGERDHRRWEWWG